MRSAALALVASLAFPAVAAPGLDLFDLGLGTPRDQVLERLRDAKLRPRAGDGPAVEVSGPLLPEVWASQTATLVFDDQGGLHEVRLELRPSADADGAQVLALFDDTKDALLRRLGPPASESLQGRVLPQTLLLDLHSGAVKRSITWRGPPPVTASIPRRLDGSLLVEVVVSTPPSPGAG